MFFKICNCLRRNFTINYNLDFTTPVKNIKSDSFYTSHKNQICYRISKNTSRDSRPVYFRIPGKIFNGLYHVIACLHFTP